MLGVGRFAQINTIYGRDVADRLLLAIARRLGPIADARAEDGEYRLLARLTAAEFALGVGGAAAGSGLESLARRFLRGFERPFAIDDRLIHVSGRAGIAWDDGRVAGAPPDVAAGLLREAAIALSDARGREPGAVARFHQESDREALARRADLESDLFRALKEGGISLLFQPQASLADGTVGGVEALVRWDHPLHGRLSAATLLETAASAELAVEVGRQIRSRAIAAAAAWTGPLAGLAPRRLVVEVTEEAIINDLDAAAATLSLLRRDGVSIALDDFGAGYSSLARLARLPVDIIKLDRSFAQGLTGSERERLVLEGTIGIACRLGLTVLAEGVEDDVQPAAARAAGCQWVQGYCVAPPLEQAALASFCSRGRARSGTAQES